MGISRSSQDIGNFLTRTLKTNSVDPDDVITSVHADSEKDSELAVEVSSWRSERAQRAPGRVCETRGRGDEKEKRKRGVSILRARACWLEREPLASEDIQYT